VTGQKIAVLGRLSLRSCCCCTIIIIILSSLAEHRCNYQDRLSSSQTLVYVTLNVSVVQFICTYGRSQDFLWAGALFSWKSWRPSSAKSPTPTIQLSPTQQNFIQNLTPCCAWGVHLQRTPMNCTPPPFFRPGEGAAAPTASPVYAYWCKE